MDNAPLNLAHFYERKANKFLKHHRFDDAIECFQIALDYIAEAYKTVEMPKAIEVLVVQEEEYKRQIRQAHYKKAYYDKKQSENGTTAKDTNQTTDETGGGGVGEQATKGFTSNGGFFSGNNGTTVRDYSPMNPNDSSPIDSNEYQIYENERKLLNLDFQITEIPSLAPLELPNFDFQIFQHTTCGISPPSTTKKD